MHHIRTRLISALLLAGLLAGCSGLTAPKMTSATQTADLVPATSAAPNAPTATPDPGVPTLAPTQEVTAAALQPTPVPGSTALISLREGNLMRGDSWGGQSQPFLTLGESSALAIHGTRLAYVANGGIFVADLATQEAPRRLADAPPAFLLGPDICWTADGQALLTIADHEDQNAQQTGRSLDIGLVTLAEGGWHPRLALADCVGVTILRADSATGQVLLVAWGAEPTFQEVLRYDLASGQLLGSLPIAGQGEIVPSPDGKLALTSVFDESRGANVDLLYDLTDPAAPVRQRLGLKPDTHTASHLWSPDGRRIAYLLRQGRTPSEEASQGLGIYIWDLDQTRATQVANISDPAGGPVSWTPDGRYLIYRQADAAGANAFYALDTTDNSIRQLPLDPASRILGWLG